MKNNNKSESRIQQEIVMWYKNTYCLEHYEPRSMIFSIPNEGRGAAASQLIQTGLYPGVADLCVIHIQRHEPFEDMYRDLDTIILFFEVKKPTGVQSPNQKKFEAHCKQMRLPYHIVRSLDEFKKIIVGL